MFEASWTLIFVWTLFIIFLGIGFLIHDRTGLRLGGILVLPLLLIYALVDLNVVVIFGVASTASFWLGNLAYTRTLLYGRRLLYVFLAASVLFTAATHMVFPTDSGVFMLAILPGLFAYNLHREGRYMEGIAAFAFWFGVLLAASAAAIWALTRPDEALPAVAWALLGATLPTGPALASLLTRVPALDWSGMLMVGQAGLPEGPVVAAGGGLAWLENQISGDGGE